MSTESGSYGSFPRSHAVDPSTNAHGVLAERSIREVRASTRNLIVRGVRSRRAAAVHEQDGCPPLASAEKFIQNVTLYSVPTTIRRRCWTPPSSADTRFPLRRSRRRQRTGTRQRQRPDLQVRRELLVRGSREVPLAVAAVALRAMMLPNSSSGTCVQCQMHRRSVSLDTRNRAWKKEPLIQRQLVVRVEVGLRYRYESLTSIASSIPSKSGL